jgi:ABC-2 type transport system permease protein
VSTATAPDDASPTTRPGRGDAFATLVRHHIRTIRISSAAWIVGLVVVAVLVVAVYESAYPTSADRAELAAQIEGNPSFEALFGPARDIDTLGGFAVWRINGVATLLAAAWLLLATSRLTRGEEDPGYAELVLAGAVGRRDPLGAALVVVGCAALLLAAALVSSLVAAGLGAGDAILVGGGQALVAATFAAAAALAAQLAASRGRATALAAGALAAAYLLRVLATGADLEWLAWATPLGWWSQLGYEPRAAPLLPFAIAIPLLAGLALFLAGRRDLGASALGYARHTGSPGSPVRSAFTLALRTTRPAVLGWIVGIGAYALLLGLLVKDMLEFFRESPGFAELVERFGLGTLDTPERFLGLPFSIIVVFVSVAAVQQVVAIREEEASGRLETLLAQPLERSRWVSGRVAAAVLALLVLVVVVGIAAATGVVLRGEDIDLGRLSLACLNLLPISLLFVGLGLAMFGLRPRLTAPVLYGVVVGGFLLEFIGAVLELPEAVLSFSPFHHVEPAPAVDPAVGPSVVMLACAVAGAVVGFLAFRRRDLEGA